MIKTLKEVTELTKEEMALYCITTTDFREAKSSIETIIRNRNEIKEEKSAEKRKYLREEQRNKRLLEVYKQDIASGNTSLREGGEGFILTKYRTLRDFADSSFRYFLATGLFSINYQRQTFQLVKGRMQESNFLLDKYGMEIDNDPTSDYAEYIDSYLGNAQEVEIWRDSRIHQDDDAKKLIHFISVHNPVLSEKFKIQYSHASDRVAKLTALNAMEHSSMNIHRVVESRELRENMAMSYPEIKKVYKEISTLRNSMLDKPLMFEWNTWRLFNLFQNSVSVVGNFLSDADGNPLRTASGGLADIVCEFEDFWLIVEVTLQTGMKQYETEGEPITRHVGNHLRMLRENGDERPVFGLFIAEKVNPELVFYLNSIAWRSSQYYGGKIRIFPLEIERLLNAFDLANLKELNSSILHDWFHEIFGDAFEKTGELDWNLNGIELLKNFISERGK
jgi:hypothetical protein